MNSWTVKGDPKLTSALARIELLSDYLDSANTLTAELAAKNLVEGKPAYWHNQRYHNAVAGIFLEEVNRRAAIKPAAEYLSGLFVSRREYGTEEHLDNLLPLNDAAVRDLMQAYRTRGAFRTYAELIRRTDRAEEAAAVSRGEAREAAE